MMYLKAKTHKAFIITHYLPDVAQDLLMEPHQTLGPLLNVEYNEIDIVFELPELDGIWVSSQHDSEIFENDTY